MTDPCKQNPTDMVVDATPDETPGDTGRLVNWRGSPDMGEDKVLLHAPTGLRVRVLEPEVAGDELNDSSHWVKVAVCGYIHSDYLKPLEADGD